jgi:hypothetical protein
MNAIEIINKYTSGEATLNETNEALKGKGFHLNPEKNIITEEEKRSTTVGCYPDMANGWGLLDSGTGTFDKVFVRDGKLVGGGMGEAFAMVFIGGRHYEVKDDTLV